MLKFTARDRLKLLGGATALALNGCGGSGTSAPPPTSVTPPPTPPVTPPSGGNDEFVVGKLRDAFTSNFPIGTALQANQVNANSPSVQIALDQFNGITPEYELKADVISPTEGVFNFDLADQIVDWAVANNMDVRGHTLLWHESTPAYFLEGTPTEIRTRLETYITTVVDHFRDRIQIWDVANEVTSVDLFRGDDGIGPDRRSDWFAAVGNADYIDWAFLAARAADPNALLFLSDYETENERKRNWMIEILQRLQDRNIPIDGVGHQFHLQLNTPAEDALAAIDAIDNQFMGLTNHITELDVNFYQDPGTCWESGTNCQPDLGTPAPDDMLRTQAQLLRDLFNGFVARPSVDFVNFWGVRDGDSWLNNVPAVRSNHPLLFDRDGQPKPAAFAITDPDYII